MIYLIKCDKTDSCKIGYSKNPEGRLAQLQTGNPFPLELVGVNGGCISDERNLHEMFRGFKMKGEWFEYTDVIREYFGVDEFFLMSLSILNIFMNISQAETRVFGYCLRYRNAKFDISKKIRIAMSKEVDLNERTILNTVPMLIEKNLLYQTEDKLYGINPRYVFHGSTSDRNQSLKALLELGYKNC